MMTLLHHKRNTHIHVVNEALLDSKAVVVDPFNEGSLLFVGSSGSHFDILLGCQLSNVQNDSEFGG